MGLFKKFLQSQKKQTKVQDGVLTIYTCRSQTDDLMPIIEGKFSKIMADSRQNNENQLIIQLKDKTEIIFTIQTDPEETFKQGRGMAGFFSQAPLGNEKVKAAALQQMTLFNCIIGIMFKVTEDEKRNGELTDAVYAVAKEINGFVLYPDMSLYHASGRLLISIKGSTDYEKFYPQACSDMLDKKTEETEKEKARREHSIAILKEKGIPYIEHLRAVPEKETVLQDKESVIKRLTATFATCLQSEIYAGDEYENPAQEMKEELSLLEKQYGVSRYFSKEEQQYLQHPEKEEAHALFGWRYECCGIFMWALSLFELQEPDTICDVGEFARIIWTNNFDSLMEKAVLRSKEEILDKQDLILRYNWACVDARIHGKNIEGINNEVIYFWHYALNWLLQVDGITDWDHIRPNT